ncbi:MAG: tRNA (adenosine(37)-N6)-dimethylallyltransferase MiaA [Alcaligenaceae bacterium]|nr:tRNA (adenosine(37)-N6)-dimethylallyltransferase MiaA [Alcaligenaceae bacterium]
MSHPENRHSPIICIAGPTAAGKSASVLAIAQRWPIEIINVDSATIYQGMDIGTAKPSKEEQAQTPQHLLDIRDPAQTYSAAEFTKDASTLIRQIQVRGRLPVLAGGTMMYYKALREGLHELPSASTEIRQELDAFAKKNGWPALHAELQKVDPLTAARLAPNDSQRVQRAMEIYKITGQPMSALLTLPTNSPGQFHYQTISLEPANRLALHERIAMRFMQMLEKGFVEEVAQLKRRPDLHPDLPSIRCVGYRQIWGHLEGEYGLAEATEKGIAATRQLAKRQITWLRAQPERIQIDCMGNNVPDQVIDAMARILKKNT